MRRHRPARVRESGRVLPWLLAVVLVLGAAAGGAWYTGALDRFLCDGGTCGAADLAPPRGLDLPEARAAAPALEPAQGPALDRGEVETAVAGLLGSRDLGPRVAFAVRDLSAEQDVYAYGRGATSLAPASTLKVLTAAAGLASLGPQTRFTTTVRRVDDATAAPGDPARLVLVGGGDPLLVTRPQRGDDARYPFQRATLAGLATQTAAALREDGTTSVTLGFDDTLFAGPGDSPDWEPQYVAGDVATAVSALWTDEGLLTEQGLRSKEPAVDATRTFARLLAARGVTVATGDPARTPAATGATDVASVTGPTVEQIVQHLLETSDNEAAEVVLRHVAIAEGQPATFAGGTGAMQEVLTGIGVPWEGNTVLDGSGLARGNRVTAASLLSVLGLAAASPGAEPDPTVDAVRGVLPGLPVAGFSGSLADRFAVPGADAGQGWVRAKTGTLSGVHSLAGVTVDADGTPLAFVALADGVRLPRTLDARAQLDRIAAALTACSCSASS